MSKRVYFLIAVLALAVAGFVLSLVLIPSNTEIALIKYKDKQYDQAMALYQQQYEDGNLTIDVVMHLNGVYLQYGEIDKAIMVMEDFIYQHPDNLEARRELGSLYQYGQRLDDYARNLEEINRIEQSVENLKELSDLYQVNENYEKHVPVAIELIEKDIKRTPEDMKSLARMLAATREYEKAIEVLFALRDHHPDEFTFVEQEFLIRLLIDADQKDKAYLQAQAYSLQDTAKLGEIARLSNIINFLISPQKAYNFIAPFAPRVDENSNLLAEYVLVLVNTGRQDDAFALLHPKYEAQTLPKNLYDELLFLAARAGERDLSLELARQIDTSGLTEKELIALVETALANDLPELVAMIDREFKQNPTALNDKPILDVVLEVATRTKRGDLLLSSPEHQRREFSDRLQVARVCALVDHHRCTNDFLNALPAVTRLPENERVATSHLFLKTRRYQEGVAYYAPIQPENMSSRLYESWIQFAAATGNMEVVQQWIDANPESTDIDLLNNLYYLSMQENQYDTAIHIAEHVHTLDGSAKHRQNLVYAYTQAGRLADALPLLRLDRDASQQARDNYLSILAKLAKQDNQYREELVEYAAKALERGVPHKQRLALIYTLINAGQADVAMPYVHQIALNEGGDWVSLYASHLIDNHQFDAAVTFWEELSERSHITLKQRASIAYALLEHGEKDRAVMLFERMAQHASITSPVVKQLMYLWGPNFNEEQISWISERALHAQTPEEATGWYKYLANGTTTETLMGYVRENPDALNERVIETPYLAALSLTNNRDYLGTLLTRRVELAATEEELKHYTKQAEAYGFPLLATAAHEKILAMQPDNADSLLFLGIQAIGRANYQAAEAYLSQYTALLEAGLTKPTAKSYQAYFYLAEMFRREQKKQQAHSYYNHTMDLIRAFEDKKDDPELDLKQMHSTFAQCVANTGDVEGAYRLYDHLLTKYPDDRQLQGDYVGLAADQKNYAKASQLLAQSAPTALIPPSAETLLLGGDVIGYELIDYNRQIVLYFDPAKRNPKWLTEGEIKQHKWINYSNRGMDRAIIAATPDYELAVEPTNDGEVMIVAVPVMSYQKQLAGEQMERRNILLDARIKLATNQAWDAVQSVNSLLEQYPDNPEVLGFTANAENYYHNWPRALDLLTQAQALQPDNQDVATLLRSIKRNHGQHVYVDGEWRQLGDNDERIGTIGFKHTLTPEWELNGKFQHDDVETDQVRRADGRIGSFDADRQRAELSLTRYWTHGEQLKAALFANNDTAGMGAYFNWPHRYGFSGFAAEYRKPYWEFVEGVLDDATRDRVEFNHQVELPKKIVASGAIAVNNYNTNVNDDVAQSFSVSATATYPIPMTDNTNYLAVGYGVDAEYVADEDEQQDANGLYFTPVPLRSRETHFLTLIGRKQLSENTDVNATVGYSFDRLGGHGPLAEVGLTHYVTEDVAVKARASYGVNTNDSNNDVTRVGVQLKYHH